ncbi:MAG: alpha-glucuronidase family glycosyl hydrolase [Rhizomicrobium sp.]
MWLRYRPVEQAALARYRPAATALLPRGDSPTLQAATAELQRGLGGLLARPISVAGAIKTDGTIVYGTPANSPLIRSLAPALAALGNEGYLIRSLTAEGRKVTVIAGNSDAGVLYGAFAYLRLLQTRQPVDKLDIASAPRLMVRIIDHWDNLNGTIERGYAGFSIWDWHKMPDYMDPRYTDYARAEASIGINGVNVQQCRGAARDPDRDLYKAPRGAGGGVPPLSHQGLCLGPLQRPDRDRRPCDRRPRSIPRCRRGGRPRPTRSTPRSPISAASW